MYEIVSFFYIFLSFFKAALENAQFKIILDLEKKNKPPEILTKL